MGSNVNDFSRDSLAYAVATGNKNAFEELILIGFDVNWRSAEDNATALHTAMLLENEEDMMYFVSVLVRLGADRHALWDYTTLGYDYSTKSFGRVTPFQLGSLMMPNGKDISSCSHARAISMSLVVPCNGKFALAPFKSEPTGDVFAVFNTHTRDPVVFVATHSRDAAQIFCNAMSVSDRNSNTSVLFYRFSNLFERVYIYVKNAPVHVFDEKHTLKYYDEMINKAAEMSRGSDILRLKSKENIQKGACKTRLACEFHKSGNMPLVWISAYEAYIGVHGNIARVVKLEMMNVPNKSQDSILEEMKTLSL